MALRSTPSNALVPTPDPAPLGRTYEPDPTSTEIYAEARRRQRELYDRLYVP